jgi:ribosomal 50S subunit-associated protein YjgA (DUF615 family)
MNGDNDARIAELEKQIESLKALLDGEIARSAEQRTDLIEKRLELLTLMKGLDDRLAEHIERAQKWEQNNRDTRIEILQLIVRLSKNDDLKPIIEPLKGIVDVHRDQIDGILRDIMRLNDAYYHVFPERLAPDVRLLGQLDALTFKPKPDADPKKE